MSFPSGSGRFLTRKDQGSLARPTCPATQHRPRPGWGWTSPGGWLLPGDTRWQGHSCCLLCRSRGPRLTPPGGSGRLFPKTHADADAATSLPRPRRDAWLKPKPSKHPSGGRGAGPHCGPPVEVTARGRPSPGSHSHGQRHEEEAFSRILWFFSDCTSHARSLKMENTRCRRVGNTRPLTRRPRMASAPARVRGETPRALWCGHPRAQFAPCLYDLPQAESEPFLLPK